MWHGACFAAAANPHWSNVCGATDAQRKMQPSSQPWTLFCCSFLHLTTVQMRDLKTEVSGMHHFTCTTSGRLQIGLSCVVDTRLLVNLRTFSGALAHWKSWRFTFTAYAGALSRDMKRLMERAVAANTDGDILNVHLSAADRATSTQLFYQVL